jgi:superfamily II DNA or RNA helicase
MALAEQKFKIYYNTDDDNISKDFYCKALRQAVLYKRTAGFFSSSSLILISKGIEELLNNNGKMQLLVSPRLSSEDIEAIKNGYANRKDIINDSLIRKFDINYVTCENRYNYLAWLIYENRLDIKVVVRKDFSNYGIFHDKAGVIYDAEGNKIAFHGSMNESETAYIDNYESINVFLSWDYRDSLRVKSIEENIDLIWEGRCNNWETYEFPEALIKKILQLKSPNKPVYYSYEDNEETFREAKEVKIQDNLILRDYQKEAIKLWLENNGKGIFEMATGTGKTITSICAMVMLIMQYIKRQSPCGIVIVVPYKVLLEQWDDNLTLFNINPIKCYESKEIWYSKLTDHITLFNKGVTKNLFAITTNATFNTIEFQNALNSISNDYIFCADEMHHLATQNAISKLPYNAKYKLGLSATLMTKYNNDNMNNLIKYFENGIIYNFPLDKAINEGYLTPYYYHPVFIELTEDERSEYLKITYQIGQRLAFTSIDSDDETLQNLFIKRARIIASAENKLNKLREMKDVIKNTHNNIFYCGDKIESNVKFVEKVNRILAYEIGIKTHTFTSEESRIERKEILNKFSMGDIQALTAIRCLDEGVDIPQLRRAFILSSGTNPKEFIQRRGRILRLSKGKDYAEIYDFVVVPSLDEKIIQQLEPEELKCEQRIILREFERFKEFAQLAINKHDAYNEILNIWDLYEK